MADELLWAMTAAGNAIAIWKGSSIHVSRRGAAPACAGARGPSGAVRGHCLHVGFKLRAGDLVVVKHVVLDSWGRRKALIAGGMPRGPVT